MAAKTIRNDLIPLKSGIVRITPIGTDGNPIYKQCVTTKREFLTSTQVTTTRTSETLPNGNGSDKDFPTDEKYNLALVTQTYDPIFHAAVAGMVAVSAAGPILYDTTITVPLKTDYSVDLTEKEPAKSADDKVHMEVRDSYGNLMEQTDSAVSEGKFKYDSDTKKISFDASAAGKSFSVVYYVTPTEAIAYKSNPVLQSPTFMVEVFAETRSAETGETVHYYSRMTRATVSGDLPNVTSQKSINATYTYNFASAPVPQGVSAFYESFSK